MTPTWGLIEAALKVAMVLGVVVRAVRSEPERPLSILSDERREGQRSDASIVWIGDGGWDGDAGGDSGGFDFGGFD